MARKPRESESGDSWLNTYADMVTLLLTFFIVLLSMSSTDEAKFNAFIRSFSSLPQEEIDEIIGNSESDIGEEVGYSLDDLYADLNEYVIANGQEDFIDIYQIEDVVYIRFSSSLFFKPDQYELLSTSIPVLDFVGDGLKQYENDIRMVNVLGFTATVDNGTYWILSASRAAVVAAHFNLESEMPSSKITAMGYANQYPVATNDTEVGRIQNRRVELIIVGTDSVEGFDISDALGQFYDVEQGAVDGSLADAYQPNGALPQVVPEPIGKQKQQKHPV